MFVSQHQWHQKHAFVSDFPFAILGILAQIKSEVKSQMACHLMRPTCKAAVFYCLYWLFLFNVHESSSPLLCYAGICHRTSFYWAFHIPFLTWEDWDICELLASLVSSVLACLFSFSRRSYLTEFLSLVEILVTTCYLDPLEVYLKVLKTWRRCKLLQPYIHFRIGYNVKYG